MFLLRAQEQHLSWAFAFCLLSCAAAQPVPCHVPHWAWPADLLAWLNLNLPRHRGTSLLIVDCGWPWFLSPDLLFLSCLGTWGCVPSQWGHCPCLCCGHPQLLTCLPLLRLLLPHTVFLTPSKTGKHVSFLWPQHRNYQYSNYRHKWMVNPVGGDVSACFLPQLVLVSRGAQTTVYKGFYGKVMNDLAKS